MRLSISHTTRYRFEQPPAHALQRLRMTPKTTRGQTIHDWNMALEGARLEVDYEDHNRNRTALISLSAEVHEVTITCTGTVETSDQLGIIGQHGGNMPLWAFLRQSPLTRVGPHLRELLGSVQSGGDPVERLHALSSAVLSAVSYEAGHTDVQTSAEEALGLGRGVCQDHTHIFLGAARALGVPARYVSGYLMMNDRVEQEAGHAWAEAHVEGLGWVGFDVSNGISPDARYVRVATGRDYLEAAPVTGIAYGAGDSTLDVSLAVRQQSGQQ
jgi:transglutaminase-like putative cysteine protease